MRIDYTLAVFASLSHLLLANDIKLYPYTVPLSASYAAVHICLSCHVVRITGSRITAVILLKPRCSVFTFFKTCIFFFHF